MKKYDLIPASVALIASLVFFILYKFNSNNGDTVNVFVNNELVSSYSIYEDRKEFIDSFNGQGGLEFEISGGTVRVIDSDCKNKICINTGTINKAGQSIVCLPQRIAITVNGKNEKEFDGFTN